MTDTRVNRFGPTSRRARRASTQVASVAVAVLALGTLAGCGDDRDDATATDDPSASATGSPNPSPTASGSASASPSETPSAAETSPAPAVPEIDPLVVQAVMGALDDRFPALIPTVLPDGWTVTAATYEEGSWTIELADATGGAVVLTQQEVALDELVSSTVGGGAEQTGKVNLKDVGLGVWGVYETGDSVGIARELAGTAVTVIAVDADTATLLAETLLTAEDADMPEAG